MDLDKYRLDDTKSISGVWHEIAPDAKLLIAKWVNTEHRKSIEKRLEKGKYKFQNDDPNDIEVERRINESLANYILIGWDGLILNGKQLKYSVQAAIDLLSDPDFKWLKEIVIEFSMEAENYMQKNIEKAEQNIKKLSSG